MQVGRNNASQPMMCITGADWTDNGGYYRYLTVITGKHRCLYVQVTSLLLSVGGITGYDVRRTK